MTGSSMPMSAERAFPELTVCDGLLELAQNDVGSRPMRTLRVWKMRGVSNLIGLHSVKITRDGLAIYPRAETCSAPELQDFAPERLSSGAPELDALLGGGLPRGSLSIVAGAPGTGKTLLA